MTSPGRYLDTFKNQFNCDSIVTMLVEVVGSQFDTLPGFILEGEQYKVQNFSYSEAGIYKVPLKSEIACDSLIRLELDVFGIFIPDAFSPNGDATNDVFRVFAQEGRVSTIDMQIFDRWGNQLFRGTAWEGLDADLGVYVYLIDIAFENGTSKSL